MTLHLSIYDSPDHPGLYAWELTEDGYSLSGCASTVNKCLSAIGSARLRIEAHRTEPFSPQELTLASPDSLYPLPTRF
jgi:hypothetical protein